MIQTDPKLEPVEGLDGAESMPVTVGPVEQIEDGLLPLRCVVKFKDPDTFREVVGELSKHLKIVGQGLGVKVTQRGMEVTIGGKDGSVELAAHVLVQLAAVVRTGWELRSADVDQACRLIRANPDLELVDLYRDTVTIGFSNKRVHPRSLQQKVYLHAIRGHDLAFGIGPAGTGKTYLAMAMALSSLYRGEVRRIILCRPAVEAGEKLGFLPGDLIEKVNPYLRPLYDALHDLAGVERAGRLIEKGAIEVAPLAFMRGRTLSQAFVILDEAQNTTREQMKMFLTRIGMESKAVVTGDPSQIDLPRGQGSGLSHVLDIIHGVEGISVTPFSDVDVVRHPLVSAIIRAYARAEAEGKGTR
jgi:phosphate starvation-inducible PhoH-like protein